MFTLPKLTESDIIRWAGEASFGRGRGYYRDGHIINPRRQDRTLKAQCLGSRPQPYHVEVTLGADGIVAGHCSCPVGGAGRCKHAAALLLTWVHAPDTFMVMEDLDTALDRRSKPELIALIRKMIDRYPDLETLLELATLSDATSQQPLDPEAIRKLVRDVFRGIGYDDWGAAYGVSMDLQELKSLGDEHLEREDWRNAATVYRVVAEEVLDAYEMMHDEEGDLGRIVNQCVTGLGQCLAATDDAIQREVILRALFDIYRWDIDFGGIDIGWEVPEILSEHATPAERQQVANWVRAILPTADDAGVSDWRRRAFGGFLLNLEAETLDDEAFLRICRETGRLRDLVERLLTLNRVDEAVSEARQAHDWDLLRLADVFTAQGHADVAERLIRERAETSQDSRLSAWLKARARERGDLDEALTLAEALFWQRPALEGYIELRDLAQSLGRWNELRAEVMARLHREAQHSVLIEIYLEEGDIDRALETLEGMEQASRWGWTGSWPIRVAQAAEESRPQAACRLYMQEAERLINARGRGNYATAATYLQRVRGIYRRLGSEDAWQEHIADLRLRHKNLPALKDELNKAGL